ncbi:MAG: class I SAM-dependent methyltransferase [Terrimicrobiaceae bacterium]
MKGSQFQPAGNYYDKYKSRNIIERHLMASFLLNFDRLADLTKASDVHEIGCGEGELTMRLAERGLTVRGLDVSPEVIETARKGALSRGLVIPFREGSIYELQPASDSASLIVCCEVMEHLPDPERALDMLASLARPYLLISVPREPIWRILNLLRGAYISEAGNTPGHIQHWSARSFLNFLKGRFHIERVALPLPWTMALCRVRN